MIRRCENTEKSTKTKLFPKSLSQDRVRCTGLEIKCETEMKFFANLALVCRAVAVESSFLMSCSNLKQLDFPVLQNFNVPEAIPP